jgi:hypothetical protein
MVVAEWETMTTTVAEWETMTITAACDNAFDR